MGQTFSYTGSQGRTGKLYPQESDRGEARRRAVDRTVLRPLGRDDDYMRNVAKVGELYT